MIHHSYRIQSNEEIQKALGQNNDLLKQLIEKLPPKTQEEPDYLTRTEAAIKLRMSLPTLNKHTKSGLIPSIKIGKKRLYRRSEIEYILHQLLTG